jgi:hypothetical protein
VNILLLASHAIAEYDDVRMFADLGFDVFAPGGYENPADPGEGLRPALPNAPRHPELVALCNEQRERHAGESTGSAIDWAKADLHPNLIEWADAIIVHHFVDTWIGGQWDRIRHKRVIWRTCGQSNPWLETVMARFDGLQIVRYSPAERRHFEAVGAFAGEDAVIRFGKYPDDYGPWIGDGQLSIVREKEGNGEYPLVWSDSPFVGNVTQNMVERGNATGLDFWLAATQGLPTRPAGPGSEKLPGGIGALSYDEMREYLRRCRAYLYTGTQPASYTLGLIEAMLSGVPVVSIGPGAFPAGLFEGHEIAWRAHDEPLLAKYGLQDMLNDVVWAEEVSADSRARAVELFGMDTIGPQWLDFLGMSTGQVERRLAGVAA